MAYLHPNVTSSAPSHRYSQCELMSAHYKQPILLIEFEEQKSFSLEVRRNALGQCPVDLKDY